MIKDNFQISGKLRIVVTDALGVVKVDKEEKNLVVTAGKGYIASRMVGTASAVMSHMAVGTDSTAAVVGQTALLAQITGGRVALTSGTASGAIVTYVATFGAGVGSGAIVEAGIFNDSTAGTMLCRTVFDVVNKGADDSMQVTWTVTVANPA